MTYAGVAVNPLAMRIRTERFKTLVILDEIHHAGDAMSWGEGVREAFEPATRRLSLTGTPFRSDINPIPFVTYAPGDDGIPRSVADFTYGYAHALADHVVRPVLFMAYSGEMQWRTRAGDEIVARLGRAAHQGHARPGAAYRPRPARVLDAGGAGGRRHAALRGAPPRPRRRRPGHRHRPGVRPRLRRPAEEDQRRGADRGALRREGRLEEDRDLRRLGQALDGRGPDGLRGRRRAAPGGRGLGHHHRHPAVLRPGRRPLRAGPRARRDRVGVPAVGAAPARLRLRDGGRSATTCSGRRVSDEDDIFAAENDLLAQANAGESASDELEMSFEALGSTASFDRVLYDGGEFGHSGEVASGSEEEMDFLGIPGLLEPDQVRELLHSRQSERAQKQKAASAPEPDTVAQLTTHEQLAVLRRELNGLVAAWHHRTGQAHGITHAALRKECGGPAAAVATADQLHERINRVREWATRQSS